MRALWLTIRALFGSPEDAKEYCDWYQGDTPDDIFNAGYRLVDGKTSCRTCGSYCGQCGGNRGGLTVEEYYARYS